MLYIFDIKNQDLIEVFYYLFWLWFVQSNFRVPLIAVYGQTENLNVKMIFYFNSEILKQKRNEM